MKKIISAILALTLILALGVPAFADGEQPVPNIEDNSSDNCTVSYGQVMGTNTEKGTVDKNEGLIITNNGTIERNSWDFEIEDNTYGYVGTNNGTIKHNGGIVDVNGEKGVIKDTSTDRFVNTNNGIIEKSSSIIKENNGTVNYMEGEGQLYLNNGTVKDNHGLYDSYMEEGELYEDLYMSIVYVNGEKGVVEKNSALVIENYGTVTDAFVEGTEISGIVEKNFGTEIKTDGNTYYGTVIATDGAAAAAEGIISLTGEREGSVLVQFVKDTVNNLGDMFKREGFTIEGWQDAASGEVTKGAEYEASAPSSIILLWKSLTAKSASSAKSAPESCDAAKAFKLIEAEKGSIKLARNSFSKQEITAESLSGAVVTVDGEKVGSKDFTLSFDKDTKELELSFSEAFLNTLAAGEHSVSLVLLGSRYSFDMTV